MTSRRAILALPFAALLPAPARALPAGVHAALFFPGAAPHAAARAHAEGEGHSRHGALGRFVLTAPPMALPDTPFAILFPEESALRPLLAAGAWPLDPRAALALDADGAPLDLRGATLRRLRETATRTAPFGT